MIYTTYALFCMFDFKIHAKKAKMPKGKKCMFNFKNHAQNDKNFKKMVNMHVQFENLCKKGQQ